MDASIVELVRQFVPRRLRPHVSEDARLLHDLYVAGDDILSLWAAFDPHEDIDMTGFNIDEYFPAEVGIDAFLLTLLAPMKSAGPVTSKYKEFPVRWLDELQRCRSWAAFGKRI